MDGSVQSQRIEGGSAEELPEHEGGSGRIALSRYLTGILACVALPVILVLSFVLGCVYFGLVELMGPMMGVK